MTQREKFQERFQKLALDVCDPKTGEKRKEYRWEMADRLELSRNTVTQYYNGKRMPDSRILQIICDKCQISPDYLLGITDIPNIDPNMQMIAKHTGLNEKAIKTLHESKENAETINMLLSNETGQEILELIYAFLQFDKCNLIINDSIIKEEMNLDHKNIVSLRKPDGQETNFGISMGNFKNVILTSLEMELYVLSREIKAQVKE